MNAPVSELDSVLAREQALTEPGCEQEPALSAADVEAIVQDELFRHLVEQDHPAIYRPIPENDRPPKYRHDDA